jgi:hypothetical protein
MFSEPGQAAERNANARSARPATLPLPALSRSPRSGAPLISPVRSHLEQRTGLDLSAVRVHTGPQDDTLCRSLRARAFTTGTDVFFTSGSYQPGSRAGQELIAHELAHVVQQATWQGAAEPRISDPGEPAEAAAREMAQSTLAATSAAAALPADSPQPGSPRRLAGHLTFPGPRSQPLGPVQREADLAAPAVRLDQKYRPALADASQTGDWRHAAELLNAFNRTDILSRLAELTDDQVAYLHLGAIGNKAIGPDSQVAQLTRPGVPRASTAEPAVSSASARAAAATEAAPGATDRLPPGMSPFDKLAEAFHRAKISAAVREKILSMITPEALAEAIIGFAAAFVASQFTPVGWAADLALGLTAVFVGNALLTAAHHLINFAAARNATTTKQLGQAGEEFARAVAEIEIDAILLLIMHSAGGPAKGGTPYQGPPPGGLVLATAEGRVFPVVASTIPVEVAGPLGIRAGATVLTMAGRPRDEPPARDFEPPVRDHEGKLGGEIPENGEERANAVNSWTPEELAATERELQGSIATRQAEQRVKGETSVGAQGQPRGAPHRVRIDDELELLRAIRKKLSGS